MILARSEKAAARCKVLALHGMTKDAWKRFGDQGYKHYQVVECGFKYNMMDLQAALGIHQLQRVEACWQAAAGDLGLLRPRTGIAAHWPSRRRRRPPAGTRSHLYTILVDKARAGISRDAFLDAMTARRIGVGVHYLSIPEHPYYQQNFGWEPEDYPQAMRVGRQTVSLPISAKLEDRDVEDVVNAVRGALSAGREPNVHNPGPIY